MDNNYPPPQFALPASLKSFVMALHYCPSSPFLPIFDFPTGSHYPNIIVLFTLKSWYTTSFAPDHIIMTVYF